MPPPGETLKHKDVHLLTVRPGTAWKRDDMAAVYSELNKQDCFAARRTTAGCDGYESGHATSQQLAQRLVDFVTAAEGQLKEGDACR